MNSFSHLLSILAMLMATSIAVQTSAGQNDRPASVGGEASPSEKLLPQPLRLSNGRELTLNIAEGFEIVVALDGLKRVRFLSQAPDGRFFATDMQSVADNSRGVVYLLEGFNAQAGAFRQAVPFLRNLRNPNSLAFYTDPRGQHWMYLALTDRLIRYHYKAGMTSPDTAPEVLARYPDYGLGYRYGGWHLTRTVIVGEGPFRNKLFVSVGSSCNSCNEIEDVRATITMMDADGRNAKVVARGLRNAVGMGMVGGNLFATNMGADHLGPDAPADTIISLSGSRLSSGSPTHFGWPACYAASGKILTDPKSPTLDDPLDCARVPAPHTSFAAHSSPLGIAWFDASATDTRLRNQFLVALHGSSNVALRRGYRVVRIGPDGRPVDFITGFLTNGRIVGRPCGIARVGPDAFLLTDDSAGVIYLVRKRQTASTAERVSQ